MPELPEVQTVVNGLNEAVLPCEVGSICELRPGTLHWGVQPQWPLGLANATRRGKFILLHGEGDIVVLAHLRMTGKFTYREPQGKSVGHIRAIFELTDGRSLWFVDSRTFGTIEILTAEQAQRRLGGLGREPLDKSFDTGYLRDTFSQRKAPVKTLLLRQDLIAGLGNIYACEILRAAGVDPRREGRSLTRDELTKIVRATREVLHNALRCNGTTIDSYRRVDEKTGEFQNMLRVYGKSTCECGAAIQRTRQAGRSTWWCPACQH